MAVTPEDVRKVADLARLRLHDDEADELTRQLNGILEHVDALGEVDIATAEAGDGGRGGEESERAPLRDDEPGPDTMALKPEQLAPAWERGFFTVPRLPALDADALDAGDSQ